MSTPPRTPIRPQQRIPPESPMSPIEEEVLKTQRRGPCKHHRVSLFDCNDNAMGYFERSYMEDRQWPTSCASCHVQFVASKEATKSANEYVVKATSPCWLCHNAENSNHECTYALCHACKLSREEKEAAKYSKRAGGAIRASRRAKRVKTFFSA